MTLADRQPSIPGTFLASQEILKPVAVFAEGSDEHVRARAERLAQALNLPLANASTASRYDLLLTYSAGRLQLQDLRRPRQRPVSIDVGGMNARRRTSLSRRQPLALAVGRSTRFVVDATAGFGRDSLLLAGMGYIVTAFERHAVIAALLQDALDRARSSDTLSIPIVNMHVIHADARVALAAVRPVPETIYLDPMFPPKRKRSALATKEMRLLRELVGDDDDANELFDISLRTAARRVVVKRHDSAPPLGRKPDNSYCGKLVRYDVYFR